MRPFRLPSYASKFLEMCLMVTADHGPAVSGAHNTIIASRASKDLVSSLASAWSAHHWGSVRRSARWSCPGVLSGLRLQHDPHGVCQQHEKTTQAHTWHRIQGQIGEYIFKNCFFLATSDVINVIFCSSIIQTCVL